MMTDSSKNSVDIPPQSLRFSGVAGSARLSCIADLANAYDQGLSPVRIIEECLARIAARNAVINAMIFVDAPGALAAAQRAEAALRSGQRCGPLHGIPVVVKDMIDVAGWPTTAASRLFQGRVAMQDARCVANLRAAGAIILGKTNLHELTVGGHDNPWFGKVVNPLDASRGTAGTSSGSAAAVAAGFCVAAVGSDTGGSNRSVAAATGLVGFKPSHGLIDTGGCLPSAVSLDTIGPITATVEDARLMSEVMAGRRFAARQNRPPNSLIVAVCPALYDAAMDPVVAQSHAVWFDQLRRSGLRIVELGFEGTEAFVAAGLTILRYEFAQYYGALIRQQPDLVGDIAHTFAEDAIAVDRAAFEAAVALRAQAKRQMLGRMHGIDLLAIPTAAGLAPRLSDECTQVGGAMLPYGAAGGRLLRWANMLGMPALALPLASDDPLPASIQIATKPGEDGLLFDRAMTLQALV